MTGVEDFPTCENCGGVGMTCCTGTNDACQSGATCELATHVCKTDPNQGSGKSHFVALETQQHCALPQQYFTVSGTQTIAAQAQVLLVAANAGLPAAQQYILGPVDVVPTTYHVCRYGGLNSVGHIDVLAFSHGELSICEQSLGSISTQWAWQGPLPDADCPGSWASNMYPPNP
ncbi:MAG: hypothetical protein ABI467_15600 [Kofleriaceae bacterium]